MDGFMKMMKFSSVREHRDYLLKLGVSFREILG